MKKVLVAFIVVFSLFSCNKEENTTDKQKQIEQTRNEIEKAVENKKVLIVQTIDKSGYTKFLDFFGNRLEQRTYYYWFNGHLFKKEFKHGPSLEGTEADFLMSHHYVDIPIGVKSYNKTLAVPLKMRIYDASIDSKSMRLK